MCGLAMARRLDRGKVYFEYNGWGIDGFFGAGALLRSFCEMQEKARGGLMIKAILSSRAFGGPCIVCRTSGVRGVNR